MEQGQRLAVSYRARRHLRRSEAPPHLRRLPLPPRRIQRPPAACGSSAPAIGQGRVCRGWFTPPIPEYCLPLLVAALRHAFGYGAKQSAWILCSVAFWPDGYKDRLACRRLFHHRNSDSVSYSFFLHPRCFFDSTHSAETPLMHATGMYAGRRNSRCPAFNALV